MLFGLEEVLCTKSSSKIGKGSKNSLFQFSFNIAEVYLMADVFKCLNFFKEIRPIKMQLLFFTFIVSGRADSFRERFVVFNVMYCIYIKFPLKK